MISIILNGSSKFAARRTLKIHSRFEFKDIIEGCLRRVVPPTKGASDEEGKIGIFTDKTGANGWRTGVWSTPAKA